MRNSLITWKYIDPLSDSAAMTAAQSEELICVLFTAHERGSTYVSTTSIIGWDAAKSKTKAATIPTMHVRTLCDRDDWDSNSSSCFARWAKCCASLDARQDSWVGGSESDGAGCSDWDPDWGARSEASCANWDTSCSSWDARWDSWAGGLESDGAGSDWDSDWGARSEASCVS